MVIFQSYVNVYQRVLKDASKMWCPKWRPHFDRKLAMSKNGPIQWFHPTNWETTWTQKKWASKGWLVSWNISWFGGKSPLLISESSNLCFHIGVSIVMAGCFIMENPSINGWFGGTPILGNLHMDPWFHRDQQHLADPVTSLLPFPSKCARTWAGSASLEVIHDGPIS